MMRTLLLSLLALPALAAVEKTIEIAPETNFCMGVAPMTCLQVRELPDGKFLNHYDSIEGFTFTPGYRYKLRITEEKREPAPADASSLVWRLKEVVEKKAVAIDPAAYQDKEWKFQGVESPGGVRALPAGDQVTLRLGKDGRVSGSAGCNRCMGAYEVGEAGALKLGPLATTRMACEPPRMETERAFLAGMGAVNRLSVADGRLFLHEKDTGARWVFAPAP